jgi:cytochrome c biogenesis protein CcdA
VNARLLAVLLGAVLVLVGVKCSGPHLFAVLLLGVPAFICVAAAERRKPAGEQS